MTYPKCYNDGCHGVALPPDPPGELIRFMGGICATCCDVEFCCNVSKDLYGTKRLAHVVAAKRGMDHVLARFAEKQDALDQANAIIDDFFAFEAAAR